MSVEVDQASLDRAMAQLQTLGKRVTNAALRKAFNRLGTKALKRMRTEVPVEKGGGLIAAARRGLTRKSLGKKVRIVKGNAMLIVGPRRGFKKVVGTRKFGKHEGAQVEADPVRTAHLAGPGREQVFIASTQNAIVPDVIPTVVQTIEEELAKRSSTNA